MKLSQIVAQGAIIPRLKSADRDAVIIELVDAVVNSGGAPQAIRPELVKRVLEREARGTTGFGKGIAVPHVKHKDVTQLSVAIGLSAGGIDFSAMDRLPVYSVFLLVSPEDKPNEHLKAMEVIFKHLSIETFRRFLRQAEQVDDVRTLLDEADAHHFGV